METIEVLQTSYTWHTSKPDFIYPLSFVFQEILSRWQVKFTFLRLCSNKTSPQRRYRVRLFLEHSLLHNRPWFLISISDVHDRAQCSYNSKVLNLTGTRIVAQPSVLYYCWPVQESRVGHLWGFLHFSEATSLCGISNISSVPESFFLKHHIIQHSIRNCWYNHMLLGRHKVCITRIRTWASVEWQWECSIFVMYQ